MAKEFDIMYYEYMMESVQADREIKELLLGVKAANILNEACEELALFEANMIKTAIGKIREIFGRVITFLKNLFKNITERKICIPKDDLVKQVENKIKNISSKDRDSFNIKNANISASCRKWVNQMNNDKEGPVFAQANATIRSKLDEVTNEFKKFMDGTGTSRSEADLKELSEDIEEVDEFIDENSNSEALKKGAKDVAFNDIKEILSLYRQGESISNGLKKNIVSVTKEMEDKQKEFIKAEDKELKVSDINYYHNIITKLTNLVVKLQKTRLQVSTTLFSNQEAILRKFVSYKSDSETNPGTALAVR